jgi:branched-chain amino acid transport system permease protein
MFYREAGQFKTTYAADMAIFPIAQDRWGMILIIAVATLGVPFLASEYVINAFLIPVLIWSLAALGLNVLVGYCGQLSLGHAAFMGVGAYAAYNFAVRLPELNLLVCFGLGGLVAALVGVVVGLPSLRIKGFYIAVATLAVQFLIEWLFSSFSWFSGGSAMMAVDTPRLIMFGYTIKTPLEHYYLTLGVVAVVTLGVKNLVRSKVGRAWMAVRDMDVAAEVIGIRPLQTKLLAFAVSAFVGGVAGSLYAFVYLKTVDVTSFDLFQSFLVLFMIIIGGLGSVLGSFLGAAFIVMTPIIINILASKFHSTAGVADLVANVEHMIFGGLIVFFLIVEPFGFARLWTTAKEKLRLWPFPH